jgi:hypothetical protein
MCYLPPCVFLENRAVIMTASHLWEAVFASAFLGVILPPFFPYVNFFVSVVLEIELRTFAC